MNYNKEFFKSVQVGDTVTFYYEGKKRDGIVNFVADRVVNLFCNSRLAYRSFSYDKIQLI